MLELTGEHSWGTKSRIPRRARVSVRPRSDRRLFSRPFTLSAVTVRLLNMAQLTLRCRRCQLVVAFEDTKRVLLSLIHPAARLWRQREAWNRSLCFQGNIKLGDVWIERRVAASV